MSRALLDDVVLKLIDAKLALNGNVTSRDINRHLGLSRQKVSRLFQEYLEANPSSMVYVPAKRKYIAKESFTPVFIEADSAGKYIDALIVVFGIVEEY